MKSPGRWRLLTLVAVLCASVVGCGGGELVSKFQPARVLSFGDENSVITTSGQRYSVSGLANDGTTVDCNLNPIWNQGLAGSFGMTFPQCSAAGSSPASRILAVPGAKAADFKTQIDQFLLTDRLASNDLVTVLVGQNDLWAQYATYNGSNEAQLIAAMEAAGVAVATQVNRLADAGAKVLVSTLPDQSLTPAALTQKAAFTDTDRAALIRRLMLAFHTKMRVALINDGKRIGLVLADEMTQQVVQIPSAYSHVNVNMAACLSTAPLPGCTTATLVSGANASTWLWADDTHLAAGGHARLAEAARLRAVGNPF